MINLIKPIYQYSKSVRNSCRKFAELRLISYTISTWLEFVSISLSDMLWHPSFDVSAQKRAWILWIYWWGGHSDANWSVPGTCKLTFLTLTLKYIMYETKNNTSEPLITSLVLLFSCFGFEHQIQLQKCASGVQNFVCIPSIRLYATFSEHGIVHERTR